MKDSQFWNEIIKKAKYFGNDVFVSTYNFNFNYQSNNSMYNRLIELANSGVNVALVYSKPIFKHANDPYFDPVFQQYVLCARVKNNHAKLFCSESFAYIGSNNFSFGSEGNYECGVLIEDIQTVRKIRKRFQGELIRNCDFECIPEGSHYLEKHLDKAIYDTKESINRLKSNCKMTATDLYYSVAANDSTYLFKDLILKLGYQYPELLSFEYWMYYGDGLVDTNLVYRVKMDLQQWLNTLIEIKNHMIVEYKRIGKFSFEQNLGLLNMPL